MPRVPHCTGPGRSPPRSVDCHALRGIDLLDLEPGSAEDVVITLDDALRPCQEKLAIDWSSMQVRSKAKRDRPFAEHPYWRASVAAT